MDPCPLAASVMFTVCGEFKMLMGGLMALIILAIYKRFHQ